MALGDFPSAPSRDASNEEVIEYVARLAKEVKYILNGGIEWDNIIAGTITADRMNVQKLSAIAADLGTIIAGSIYSAFISTAANGAFPRIELSNTSNLLQALFSDTNFIQIAPVYSSNPAIIFDNGVGRAFLSAILGNMDLTVEKGSLTLQSNDSSVFIFSGAGKNVMFQDWTFPKNQASGRTLQQDFDAKIDKPTSTFTGSFSVVTGVNFVAQTTTTKSVSVSNGVITSVV